MDQVAPRFARPDRLRLGVPLLVLSVLLSRALLEQGRPLGWDHGVDALRFIPSDPSWAGLAEWVSVLGTGWVLYPALVLTAVVRVRRGQRIHRAAAPLGVLITGQLLRTMLLAGIAGSRPEFPLAQIEGPSFSSGHAMAAALGWGLIAREVLLLSAPRPRMRRLTVGAAILLVAAVGASRVYLGVHWSSDVVGGWAFGFLFLIAAGHLLRAGARLRTAARARRFVEWARSSRLAWMLPVAAAALSIVPLLTAGTGRMKDLLVYHDAAAVAVHGGDVYAVRTVFDMPFTYPPFAAVLAGPLAWIPLGLTQVLWCAGTLLALVALARVTLDAAVQRIGLPLTIAAMLIATPVRSDLRFGQIGVFLVLLVAVDLLRCRRGGLGVGIAGALKLTPLVVLPWLLMTRSWTRLRRSLICFGFCSVTGAVVLWRSGSDYVRAAAFDTGRFGANDIPGNQSLRGMVLRTGLAPHSAQLLWLTLSLPISILALRNAYRLEILGNRLGAVGVLAAWSVVISPISWVHHLIWLVLPIAGLVAAGRHRLAVGWLALLAVGLPALGHRAQLVSPGHAPVWALVIDLQGLTAVAAAVLLPLCLTRDQAASDMPAP